MRADPDGLTLLFTNPGYTMLPITDSTVKYDPVKALMNAVQQDILFTVVA